MDNIKEIIEEADFSIAQDYPYEGIVCARGRFKHIRHRTRRPLFFAAPDLLIDAVILQYRSTPRVSAWRKLLPMEAIEYCYAQVPRSKMSFVLDFTKNAEADPNMEFLICVFEDRHVKKTPAYQRIYQMAVAQNSET